MIIRKSTTRVNSKGRFFDKIYFEDVVRNIAILKTNDKFLPKDNVVGNASLFDKVSHHFP